MCRVEAHLASLRTALHGLQQHGAPPSAPLLQQYRTPEQASQEQRQEGGVEAWPLPVPDTSPAARSKVVVGHKRARHTQETSPGTGTGRPGAATAAAPHILRHTTSPAAALASPVGSPRPAFDAALPGMDEEDEVRQLLEQQRQSPNPGGPRKSPAARPQGLLSRRVQANNLTGCFGTRVPPSAAPVIAPAGASGGFQQTQASGAMAEAQPTAAAALEAGRGTEPERVGAGQATLEQALAWARSHSASTACLLTALAQHAPAQVVIQHAMQAGFQLGDARVVMPAGAGAGLSRDDQTVPAAAPAAMDAEPQAAVAVSQQSMQAHADPTPSFSFGQAPQQQELLQQARPSPSYSFGHVPHPQEAEQQHAQQQVQQARPTVSLSLGQAPASQPGEQHAPHQVPQAQQTSPSPPSLGSGRQQEPPQLSFAEARPTTSFSFRAVLPGPGSGAPRWGGGAGVRDSGATTGGGSEVAQPAQYPNRSVRQAEVPHHAQTAQAGSVGQPPQQPTASRGSRGSLAAWQHAHASAAALARTGSGQAVAQPPRAAHDPALTRQQGAQPRAQQQQQQHPMDSSGGVDEFSRMALMVRVMQDVGAGRVGGHALYGLTWSCRCMPFVPPDRRLYAGGCL